MNVRSAIRTLAVVILLFPSLAAQDARPRVEVPDRVEFNRDIRPLLYENCIKCHGSDVKSRKGNLRLDTKDGAFGEIEKGRFALVPGDLEKSELWRRIATSEREDLMPPSKSGKKLTRPQIETFKRWIQQGAQWQGHWAFLPPKKTALPPTRTAGWGRNSIDAFILARLEAEGLTPSVEADRATLGRRVTLDLTGLPPTTAEVNDFVGDPAPNAYERLVDRLLASSRFGENMTRFWLDLARYGDTHGLHLDNYREMWPYRDWVIRAFNRNQPFNQFVTEQLAGDLLQNPTLDQQVASGFNRCHVTTSEGGSIEEEVYCRNVFDRTETFAQVFLALTFTCCRCHDHKFDPVTQKEYYQLFAFFNSMDGQELDGNKKDPAPVTKVPSAPQAAELATLRDAAGKIEARLDGPNESLDAAQAGWEKELAARLAAQWTAMEPKGFKAVGEAALKGASDKSVQVADPRLSYEVSGRVSGEAIHGLLLEILPPNPEPPADVSLAFTLSAIEADFGGEKIEFSSAHLWGPIPDAAAKNLIEFKGGTGWSGDARKKPAIVLVPSKPFGSKDGGDLRVRLVHDGAHSKQPVQRFRVSTSADADLLKGVQPVASGPWHALGRIPAADGNVAFTTEFGPEKGADLAKGVGELGWTKRDDYVDGKDHPYPPGVGASFVYHTLNSPSARRATINVSSDDAIQMWLNGSVVLARNVKRTFRKYDADKVAVELEKGENKVLIKLANYGTSRDHKFSFELVDDQAADLVRDAADALAQPAEKRTDAQKAALRTRYRRDHWPEWTALNRQRGDLRGKEKVLLDQVPTTLIFKERATPRDSYILKRGEYDKRGDKVVRGLPGALPVPPKDLPMNRLGLASWLLDPGHPLTARVAVNRFWQQVFGVGIVKTSEDFGLQSQPPSHPELLDHLATQFIEDGWDVKRMMKRLVMSATYRQSSRMTPDLLRRDPDNRLLARGPRYRLDAEMVRDQILFVSGLLVEQVGGPSVKPPQPEGLWEAVGYTGSNTYRFVRDPEPQKVFRRSMYIFWKRTSAPPQMTLFDAPSRESCIARRERTNTPLQALFLMNEPQCFEAARHFAQKALKEGGSTPEERAAWMLQRAVLRAPTPQD
ncbi:MAG TPA: PSD1 and planctomycete cytochrome C domain-containing protein, partial [Planctomycetota bacterium]|nr:PSD1 and planctomycete cytochrome C domain-containing protein [Planctomycetota bacterium]